MLHWLACGEHRENCRPMSANFKHCIFFPKVITSLMCLQMLKEKKMTSVIWASKMLWGNSVWKKPNTNWTWCCFLYCSWIVDRMATQFWQLTLMQETWKYYVHVWSEKLFWGRIFYGGVFNLLLQIFFYCLSSQYFFSVYKMWKKNTSKKKKKKSHHKWLVLLKNSVLHSFFANDWNLWTWS